MREETKRSKELEKKKEVCWKLTERKNTSNATWNKNLSQKSISDIFQQMLSKTFFVG